MVDSLARMRQIIGTTAQWGSNNLVLGDGEIAIERISGTVVKARVGNGVQTFAEAPYLGSDLDIAAADARYVLQAQTFTIGGISAANKWPRLNQNGQLDESLLNLPSTFHYKGTIDPASSAPLAPEAGDAYAAVPGGTVGPTWGAPVAGQAIDEGELLIMTDDGTWSIYPSQLKPTNFITWENLSASNSAARIGASSGTVQSSLDLLWNDKVAKAGDTMTGPLHVKAQLTALDLYISSRTEPNNGSVATALYNHNRDLRFYINGGDRGFMNYHQFVWGSAFWGMNNSISLAFPHACHFCIADTSAPGDRRWWDMIASGSELHFRGLSDNETQAHSFLRARRFGGTPWSPSDVTIFTGGVPRIHCTEGGGVGINTEGPQAELDIRDNGDGLCAFNMGIANNSVVGYFHLDNWGLHISTTASRYLGLGSNGLNQMEFRNNGEIVTFYQSWHQASIHPVHDNQYDLGWTSNRWATIYLINPPRVGSDEREKVWRGTLTELELQAAARIADEIGTFQRIDDLDKGDGKAALRIGVRAQKIWAIMAELGLIDPFVPGGVNTSRYNFLFYSDKNIREPEIQGSMPVEGNLLDHFAISYEELNMFLLAAQEQRIRRLEQMMQPVTQETQSA